MPRHGPSDQAGDSDHLDHPDRRVGESVQRAPPGARHRGRRRRAPGAPGRTCHSTTARSPCAHRRSTKHRDGILSFGIAGGVLAPIGADKLWSACRLATYREATRVRSRGGSRLSQRRHHGVIGTRAEWATEAPCPNSRQHLLSSPRAEAERPVARASDPGRLRETCQSHSFAWPRSGTATSRPRVLSRWSSSRMTTVFVPSLVTGLGT